MTRLFAGSSNQFMLFPFPAPPGNGPIDPARYSAEIRFGSGVSYTFMDVIRRRANSPNVLFTPGQDKGSDLLKYLTALLEMARDLIASEERLMKINAPAVVIGDIRGNLQPMLTIEELLCPTAPVLQENLVFLGNYISPKGQHNVEVLCFLMALKIQAPNQILLLRGYNENIKEAKGILERECQKKYGEVAPQVYALLTSVLEKLPFAVIIDESILCLHSGVPKTARRVIMLTDIPCSLPNIEDNATAFEVSPTCALCATFPNFCSAGGQHDSD